MGGWRGSFRGGLGDPLVHPNAPAGGSGFGDSRVPHDTHGIHDTDDVPHPDSPAARFFDWTGLSKLDTVQRAQDVLEAVDIGERHAPAEILEATGEELGAMLKGILPGLALCLAWVALTTTVGGAAGAAIGALAGGAGAIPGAVVGAGIGLDAGLFILEWAGLAFMAAAIGSSLWEAIKLAGNAMDEAWHAVDHPRHRAGQVNHAGHTLARALGVLMKGILQGVIAFLLAKGAESAATRVPELVAKLRQSRFGETFAAWVESSWGRLLKNEKLLPKKQPQPGSGVSGKGSGGGAAREAPKESAPAPKPKEEAAPPKPKEEPAKPPEEKPGSAKTPAERAALLRDMQDAAKNASVETPENGLTLWSGGGMNGSGKVAMDAAKASGGKTLEMTEAGQKLTAIQKELGPYDSLSAAEKAQVNEAWTTASKRLANEASGEVNVVCDPTKMRKDAILFDELGRLGKNDAVTSVTVTDTSGNVISSGSAEDAATALRAIVK